VVNADGQSKTKKTTKQKTRRGARAAWQHRGQPPPPLRNRSSVVTGVVRGHDGSVGQVPTTVGALKGNGCGGGGGA